jgi:hypothetical protein
VKGWNYGAPEREARVAFGSNVTWLFLVATAVSPHLEDLIRRMTPVSAPPEQ